MIRLSPYIVLSFALLGCQDRHPFTKTPIPYWRSGYPTDEWPPQVIHASEGSNLPPYRAPDYPPPAGLGWWHEGEWTRMYHIKYTNNGYVVWLIVTNLVSPAPVLTTAPGWQHWEHYPRIGDGWMAPEEFGNKTWPLYAPTPFPKETNYEAWPKPPYPR